MMGSLCRAANWNASLTSPSVTEPSPREQMTTGGMASFLRPCVSMYLMPCATPVVGMTCMPVALLWWMIFGYCSRRLLAGLHARHDRGVPDPVADAARVAQARDDAGALV